MIVCFKSSATYKFERSACEYQLNFKRAVSLGPIFLVSGFGDTAMSQLSWADEATNCLGNSTGGTGFQCADYLSIALAEFRGLA
jgi:hypothetical protein